MACKNFIKKNGALSTDYLVKKQHNLYLNNYKRKNELFNYIKYY